MTEVLFRPPRSTLGFIKSDKFISLILGPIGSTKTTAGLVKLARMAKRMAPCDDKIRRSRCIWIRNTREQLRDSSIPDFLKWYPDGQAGTFTKSEYNFVLRFDDVECEVMFRGLDDAKDVRRLLSVNASFAVVEEFREINQDIYEVVQGRLGRYPDGMMVPHRPEWGVDGKGNPVQGCVTEKGESNKHIWGMSNPPDMETFWERTLSDPPDNVAVFIQPSAMSPSADWLHFLPTDYYDNLAEGKSEEYIDVYIHAKFGKSLAGLPVFRAYDPDYHTSKGRLKPILNGMRPIVVGLDFGLTPAAMMTQLDPRGRFLVLGELNSSGMGIVRFCDTLLKPYLYEHFPGAPIAVAGDPAGRERVQTDERTVYEILKQKGFKAFPARTNSIVARIAAVEQFLTRQVDGEPGFLLDKEMCPKAHASLRGKYRYKLKQNGESEDLPEKNEASHGMDALQYAAMHADMQVGGLMYGPQRRKIMEPTVSAAGWT